ncbi:hypothetical protein [Jannaschia sp. R86511]|uniref:hypothetical protein n=1 Tax=Jannaschia sp. R86511 TaxID=3093853 RepID=UPI0036D3937E
MVVAVGAHAAEARWVELATRGRIFDRSPAGTTEPPEALDGRARRLADVQVDAGLAEAVHVASLDEGSSEDSDDYEHVLWLEEWLELAVGAEALHALEAAVAAHPLVEDANHEDREVLSVAAPTLHPEDVRQVVLEVLAEAYNPDWSRTA